MSNQIIPYIHNGERRWALYSDTVDGITMYDVDAQEIIEYKAYRAAQRARRQTAQKIIELQNNGYNHRRPITEDIADIARRELEEIHAEEDTD